jgi:hypothetical protein
MLIEPPAGRGFASVNAIVRVAIEPAVFGEGVTVRPVTAFALPTKPSGKSATISNNTNVFFIIKPPLLLMILLLCFLLHHNILPHFTPIYIRLQNC